MAQPSTIIGYAFLDNFDEIMEEMDETMRPALVAKLDGEVTRFAYENGGTARKYDNNKFMLVFDGERMETLKREAFPVLGRIRSLETGGINPVTLSIGLGFGGESVAANLDRARAAVDLALGRGGDQAVVKDGEQYVYFGGVAREFSLNARTRARLKATALAGIMRECSNVLVAGHKNMDLDCFGAAVGVSKIASSVGKPCAIVMGNMTTNVQRIYNRIRKEEGFERDFINVGGWKDVLGPRSLVVVVDTCRPSIVEDGELLAAAEGCKLVVLDHHRMASDVIERTVMKYHEPYASSTCELVTELIQYTRPAPRLRPAEADALLAGIIVDTKSFSVKTGARTFETAAFLRRSGADSVRVKLLFQSDLASFQARAAAVGGAEIIYDNMAISVSPTNVDNPQIVAAQSADELLNIDSIEASFVLCYYDGSIYVSARSLGAVNVQLIMEKLGGGGHQTVAGAQLKNKAFDDLNEAEDQLKHAIHDYCAAR